MNLVDIPAPWRALVSEINGGRTPDGEPGIRDVDAPCSGFIPSGKPWEDADGSGSCETDGHYLCRECWHISGRALRRRQDRCEDCDTKLAGVPNARVEHAGVHCPRCDVS